jgi:prophage regulatory protein
MQSAETKRPLRILRRPEVETKTGYPTSTIYEMMSRGVFPRPIQLGPKSVGWVEAEVDEHLEARIRERDAKVSA